MRVPTQKATATATHAAATATITTPGTSSRWYITRILGSISAGGPALVTVLDGVTVIWQGYATASTPISEWFSPPLEASANAAISCVTADAGVANISTANIQATLQP